MTSMQVIKIFVVHYPSLFFLIPMTFCMLNTNQHLLHSQVMTTDMNFNWLPLGPACTDMWLSITYLICAKRLVASVCRHVWSKYNSHRLIWFLSLTSSTTILFSHIPDFVLFFLASGRVHVMRHEFLRCTSSLLPLLLVCERNTVEEYILECYVLSDGKVRFFIFGVWCQFQ